MNATSKPSNAYATLFKGWNVKVLGEKPTDDQLAAIHALGARPGKQALANSMYLRDSGATNGQVVIACGAAQLNKMRELVTRKLVKRDMNAGQNEAGHTVYKISLTAAGEAKVKKAETAEVETPADKPAKPAKGKGTRKAAAKGKGKPVTAEAPAVQTEPVATAEPVSAE